MSFMANDCDRLIIEAFNRGNYGRNDLKHANTFISNKILYSYGHHYPLAIKLSRGDGYSLRTIVNNCPSTATTSSHRSLVREDFPVDFSVLANYGFNLVNYPNIIIEDLQRGSILFTLCKKSLLYSYKSNGEFEIFTLNRKVKSIEQFLTIINDTHRIGRFNYKEVKLPFNKKTFRKKYNFLGNTNRRRYESTRGRLYRGQHYVEGSIRSYYRKHMAGYNRYGKIDCPVVLSDLKVENYFCSEER
jgi:hypothetical protein